jgi:hypothetical protein
MPHEAPAATSNRVHLVDGDAKHARRICQILRPVVAELTTADHFADDSGLDGGTALLMANYDAMDVAERERVLGTFAEGRTTARLLLLSDGRCKTDYPTLFSSRAMTNLLASSHDVDGQELIVTVQKILRGNIFGIEKYFVWGIEPLVLTLRSSMQKAEALHAAEGYIARVGVGSRLARGFYTVVDEFVTNAIYNAPTDERGAHRFTHLPRTTTVTLAEAEQVTLMFCFDGSRLGASISDPFGSVSPDRIMDYIAKCFRGGADQVDDKEGGAGLGLYYIFDALSSFVINIQAGVRTEMIGLIDVTTSFKDFSSKGKSFNIFVSP